MGSRHHLSSGEEIVPCCPNASPRPLRFSQPDPHRPLQGVIRRPVARASSDGEDEVVDRAFEGTHVWQQDLFCCEPLRHERDQIAREPQRILPVEAVTKALVHRKPRIGNEIDQPILRLPSANTSRSPHMINVGTPTSRSREGKCGVSSSPLNAASTLARAPSASLRRRPRSGRRACSVPAFRVASPNEQPIDRIGETRNHGRVESVSPWSWYRPANAPTRTSAETRSRVIDGEPLGHTATHRVSRPPPPARRRQRRGTRRDRRPCPRAGSHSAGEWIRHARAARRQTRELTMGAAAAPVRTIARSR